MRSVSRESELQLNNVLLIAGEGRNVGKTTLGCNITSRLTIKEKVIAIKISPHFHQLTESLSILMNTDSIVIARETDKLSGKDSSRYLNAGASEVYYIQCKENGLSMLASWIKDNISPGIPVICESGGLGRKIIPGYNIFIMNGFGNNEELTIFQSETIYNNGHPEMVDSTIERQNNTWQK